MNLLKYNKVKSFYDNYSFWGALREAENYAERNKNNITQLALAKELGVSRSSVNAWEMGISMPTIDRLIDIAEYFHVSVDYLLGLNDRLTIDISSLNEKEKTMIYNLIEIFINSQK